MAQGGFDQAFVTPDQQGKLTESALLIDDDFALALATGLKHVVCCIFFLCVCVCVGIDASQLSSLRLEINRCPKVQPGASMLHIQGSLCRESQRGLFHVAFQELCSLTRECRHRRARIPLSQRVCAFFVSMTAAIPGRSAILIPLHTPMTSIRSLQLGEFF